MSDEAPDSPPAVVDPLSYMGSVAIELHEMFLSLQEVGFTKKEALYVVGQAVAAGVMLPIEDFSPEDEMGPELLDSDEDEDDEDFPLD